MGIALPGYPRVIPVSSQVPAYVIHTGSTAVALYRAIFFILGSGELLGDRPVREYAIRENRFLGFIANRARGRSLLLKGY